MSRITGVIVALATTAAVLTGSTGGHALPAAAPPTAEMPRDIPGGVELTLADGDLLRLWAAENHRAVFSRRLDAATGVWGPRLEVVRRKNLSCGGVDARTSNGAVAAIAFCDRYGYSEDTAPVSSRALWSPDGVTWSSYTLEGEAYEEPGISPDGQNAVWPLHSRYTARTAGGFTEHDLDTDGQEYTVTATIDDDARVSYLYFAQLGRRCRLVVQTRTGDATPARQELQVAGGCSDVALANVDSDTVWYGDPSSPAQRAVVSRADASSPWGLTAIAPATAPGLYQTWRALDRTFFTAPGLPLFALGSTDRRSVMAQSYDPSTQTWATPVTVLRTRERCYWDDTWTAESLGVLVADLRCGDHGRRVTLTTNDGSTWQVVRGSRNPRGLSADGQYVAIPARSTTYIISRELGVLALPGGVADRCDMVVPDGPAGAVRLTSAGRSRGWPTVLQHSSGQGWTRLGRTSLPTPPRDCRFAQTSWVQQDAFDVFGRRDQGYTVRIVERAGEWTTRHERW
ncbi:hypothetical protein SAMN05192575_103117 [Nocardioides alpinus]|uniref:BNR repeat-containing family member n=1 Tax=Nocardioides alpinus TaxID=748909 RepID=A0A1I0Y0Y4_9ACTN|nr:hypothetical protein [Nocardioides alpinus]PKH42769.1 hypothetical protein CXG46_05775 [Nocardioides alpinus]SFB05883.1 hypothetical protein SAMN05192575_103117 [Nocardioides alpinus]